MPGRTRSLLFTALALVCVAFTCEASAQQRKVISLNGIWQVAEGSNKTKPEKFNHKAAVPGLLDTAEPKFVGVGRTDRGGSREAFWYRRTFTIDGDVPQSARLKICKAKYGSVVWLNGQKAGENIMNFTPGIYDVTKLLKGNGQENEIVVRVGASQNSTLNKSVNGADYEKSWYLPGIYDDVELILANAPYIVRVQVMPRIERHSIRVVAWIRNPLDQTLKSTVRFQVKPYKKDTVVADVETQPQGFPPGHTIQVGVNLFINDCKLWSPDSPNLYTLFTGTKGDSLQTRFGMREFHFDASTKAPILNGKPIALLGTNVCFLRFTEDPTRGNKPWEEAWVRRLIRQFKSMNWNICRYCIGLPPRMWYRIADEEGILIQDEYPIWTMRGRHPSTKEMLIAEFTAWLQEHWNYPCIIIWDAQNETPERSVPQTGQALSVVRHIDLSDRPWDNGWGNPHRPTDPLEIHTYRGFKAIKTGVPRGVISRMPVRILGGYALGQRGNPTEGPVIALTRPDRYTIGKKGYPIIMNEYGWLWLRRDGSAAKVTQGYNKMPRAERFEFYARRLAALTEIYRVRKYPALMHFCGLGHSHPECTTSDNFTDLETLNFEPNFEKYVKPAFAPVGLCIAKYKDVYRPAEEVDIPVVVINDTTDKWSGPVEIAIVRGKEILDSKTAKATVQALDRVKVSSKLNIPKQPGDYEIRAEILGANGSRVRSLRQFKVAE